MTKEQVPGVGAGAATGVGAGAAKDVASKMQQGPGQVPPSTEQEASRGARPSEEIKPQRPGEAEKSRGIDSSGRK